MSDWNEAVPTSHAMGSKERLTRGPEEGIGRSGGLEEGRCLDPAEVGGPDSERVGGAQEL